MKAEIEALDDGIRALAKEVATPPIQQRWMLQKDLAGEESRNPKTS